jgi:hypothetical protein
MFERISGGQDEEVTGSESGSPWAEPLDGYASLETDGRDDDQVIESAEI